MKRLISIAMMALVVNVFAQAPAIQWQKSLGGSSDEYANDIELTNDGGYIVAGYSQSVDGDVTGNHGGTDYWVVKLDAAGNIQWQQCYGGTSDDEATSIHQTADGGYIVAGYSESVDGDITAHHGAYGIADYWVIKLNLSGSIEWQNSLGGTDYDGAFSIQQTSDGGYIVAGFTQSTDDDVSVNHGGSDYWVVKLIPAGDIAWEKSFGGTSYDNAISIQQTIDNGYIVAGTSYSNDDDVSFNHGLTDYWIVKLNETGEIQWDKSYGGTDSDNPTSILQTTDEGYIIAGYTNSTDGDVTPNYASPEYWIVKTDVNGVIQWEKSYGGQGSDEAYAVCPTTDGGYIVAGRSGSFDFDVTGNHGVLDCWLVKLNTTGVIQWQQCYGGPWDDGATMIHQTADGGYIFAGHSMLNGGDVTDNHGGHDYWVVKLGILEGIHEINYIGNLTIFPNPADEVINIYSGNILAETPFSITDQTGKTVLTGRLLNVTTSIAIDKLLPGVYILQAGEQHKQLVKIMMK